jgi:cysteinyl-tRNA synthetase
MHVAPINMAGEKMSKSLGNMVFAQDLLKDYEPAVIRLALMHYHHHIGGEWKDDYLNDAEQLLAGVRKASRYSDDAGATKLLENIRLALDDDINTPEVINILRAYVASTANHAGQEKASAQPFVLQTLELIGLV